MLSQEEVNVLEKIVERINVVKGMDLDLTSIPKECLGLLYEKNYIRTILDLNTVLMRTRLEVQELLRLARNQTLRLIILIVVVMMIAYIYGDVVLPYMVSYLSMFMSTAGGRFVMMLLLTLSVVLPMAVPIYFNLSYYVTIREKVGELRRDILMKEFELENLIIKASDEVITCMESRAS